MYNAAYWLDRRRAAPPEMRKKQTRWKHADEHERKGWTLAIGQERME